MKHDITPFNYNGHQLSTITDEHGEVWFIAKEVAEILDYSDAHEMTTRLDPDEKQNRQIAGFGNRGVTTISESGLYSAILGSTKQEAKPFKKWVTSEVLPSIRRTGGYSAQSSGSVAPPIIEAFKLAPLVVRAARALGLDKNSAAISANQAVAKLTGTNVLSLLGSTHLEAENQTAMFFTPTELGERLGISGRKFNMLLAEAGLQAKKGEHWVPLTTADGFCRIMDTGKRHGDGTMIQQVKWAENVLELVQLPADERGAA